MSRRTLTAVGALVLFGGALAGCASGVPSSTPSPTGTVVTEVEVDAAWLDGGSSIAVLLRGSSTCLPMADDVAYDAGVLRVSLLDPADTACSRDQVLRGIPVALPPGIDPAHDLEIEVSGAGYRGDTALAGAAGLVPGGGLDGGQPSAGWAGDHTFALLTWGSSSCRPQVESAAVPTPGEIVVTFATSPVEQVCTADFGPRVTVVPVPGVDDTLTYVAVLTGDGFEATPVPIAGTP